MSGEKKEDVENRVLLHRREPKFIGDLTNAFRYGTQRKRDVLICAGTSDSLGELCAS